MSKVITKVFCSASRTYSLSDGCSQLAHRATEMSSEIYWDSLWILPSLLEIQILDVYSKISLNWILRYLYWIFYCAIVIFLYSVVYKHKSDMLNKKRHIMKSPMSRSNCEICLWSFGTKSELDVHNYLEHLIINGVQPSRIVESVQVITSG